jgi:hypothetical protein
MDIAKLLFSCEVGYDYVDIGHCDIDIDGAGGSRYEVDVMIPSSRTLYTPLGGGASAADVVSVEQSLSQHTRVLYRRAGQIIRDKANAYARAELKDETIVDRAEFYAAVFSLCLANSHYLEKPDGALALFIRGCDLLAKWNSKTPGH